MADLRPDVWGVTNISFFVSDTEIGDIQLVQPGVYPISIEMRTKGQELSWQSHNSHSSSRWKSDEKSACRLHRSNQRF